jgi:hypothetical protein
MDSQMNKTKLIELLCVNRAQWDAVLAEVPTHKMTEPGVAGEWSVKDIIAHINFHECWYADRLEGQRHGEIYVPTELDIMPFDARNDLIFQQNRERPLFDVLAESHEVFQRLIQGVQASSEAFLIQPQQFPGAPQNVIIWHMLRGDVYEHYREHIASIRAWLASHRGQS